MNERFEIAHIASLYQISPRTLRYYEEAGILQSHRKPDSKYREYDKSQCERLEVILLLRRLSFSVKMIAQLLNGDDEDFRTMLRAKIEESGKKLLEVREVDSLLRDLERELSRKPITEFNAAEVLNGYTYLTNKTERTIPMNSPQEEKYRIAISLSIALEVCNENEGKLLEKIVALRTELEKESITVPKIRIYDNADLPQGQAVIMWEGKEAWRKDFLQTEAVKCADEIAEQIRIICSK